MKLHEDVVDYARNGAFSAHPSVLLPGQEPLYTTNLGAAYLSDSLGLLSLLPDESVNLVVTSPPYALHFQKEYGNVDKSDYVPWLEPFGRQIHRVLKEETAASC